MNNSAQNTLRLAGAALRALLVLTLVTGVLFPLLITGVAQAAFPHEANGSTARAGKQEVGSELVGQPFDLPKQHPRDAEEAARPDPKWFQPRPSNSGYDPLATGSSQLSSSNPTLVAMVKKAREQVARFNRVPVSEVPADAVTGSASSIDPDVSPAYARIQVQRVAIERELSPHRVAKLVRDHTQGRTAGFLGQEHVNVLELNIALRGLSSGLGNADG